MRCFDCHGSHEDSLGGTALLPLGLPLMWRGNWLVGVIGSVPFERKFEDYRTGRPNYSCLVQVRDFIHDSLYHPKEGYFSGGPSVGSPSKPIDFNSLGNELAYFNHVQALYASLQVSWLTPVEIFQPYYGAAIARFMADRWLDLGSPGPLHIYEIGGGTGMLAQNVLVRGVGEVGICFERDGPVCWRVCC